MGVWPDYFKHSKTVVIPKPEKPAYNIPKVFCSIVLLNTLGVRLYLTKSWTLLVLF